MTKRLNLSLIAIFALVAIFFATSVHTSADTFFFMSTGREVWQQKSIPKTDKFQYGPQNKTLFSVEWASGVIYYLFVTNFGLNSLIFIRIVLALATVYFVYITCKLFTKNNLLLYALILFTAYILSARTNDRPESFSYLFVAFVNYLYLSYFTQRKLNPAFFLLPLIFLGWPNFHPFSIVGVGLVAFYCLLVLTEKIKNKSDLPYLNRFFAISILAISLSLIQFQRLFAFLKAGTFAGANLVEFGSLKDRILQTHGFQLLNQVPFDVYFYLVFLALLIAVAAIGLKHSKNLTLNDRLLLLFNLIFILIPFKYFRTIPLAVIVTLPSFVFLATRLKADPKYLKPLAYVTLGIFLLLVAGSIPNGEVIGSRENTFVITSLSQNGQQTPVGVVNRWWLKKFPENSPQIIKSYLNSKHIFTSSIWNNYLIWYFPNIQTFADAQTYNRKQQDYREESILLEGSKGWQELLERFDIDTVIKSQPNTMAFVYTPVQNFPNWKLIYLNNIYIIYARHDVIKSIPVDLSKVKPELATALKFDPADEKEAINQLQNLLSFDTQNGFARDQLIIYYLQKDTQKALLLAQQSRQMDPKNPIYSLHLAEIYAKLNDCKKAKSFAEEAKVKSLHHLIIDGYADDAVSTCP